MRQHVEPQVRGADRIGLLDHELPPRIEPGRGSRERERNEETQQAEHRAIDRPDARPRALGITHQAAVSNAAADLLKDHHADEDSEGEQAGEEHVGHVEFSGRGRLDLEA